MQGKKYFSMNFEFFLNLKLLQFFLLKQFSTPKIPPLFILHQKLKNKIKYDIYNIETMYLFSWQNILTLNSENKIYCFKHYSHFHYHVITLLCQIIALQCQCNIITVMSHVTFQCHVITVMSHVTFHCHVITFQKLNWLFLWL